MKKADLKVVTKEKGTISAAQEQKKEVAKTAGDSISTVAQEVEALVAKAVEAGEKMRGFAQEQLDAIVKAMTLAGVENHVELAKLAWTETGKGYMKIRLQKPLATEYIYITLKMPRPLVWLRRTTKKDT